MDQKIRNTLRETVLKARFLLEKSTREELQGRYGIYTVSTQGPESALLVVEQDSRMGHLDAEEHENRSLLLDHLEVLKTEGLSGSAALDAIVREIAFTWLNRFVAFKMMEARGLIRETVSRLENSNGFKMWLTELGNEAWLVEYEKGDMPLNGRGEGPRQRAYRAFLLEQCRKLSEEIRVLFDPDSLVSRFTPTHTVLKELVNLLNQNALVPGWQRGNEEVIGWMYQDFNEFELEPLRGLKDFKITKELIPAKTQKFTPRWIVRFLVENTLGRLWLEMHPDSRLASSLEYLVPCTSATYSTRMVKSIKDITLLDPASGTMHFGLVAFDLFVEMYREEIQNAGKPGWPEEPPVSLEDDIPNAIISRNLHGIDIDLRAVQLSALTLYIKAKTLNPHVHLRESRLACANVHMLANKNLEKFLEQLKIGPTYRRILTALEARLKDSEQLGSLIRLEKEIKDLVDEERNRFRHEAEVLDLFGVREEAFGMEAEQQEFWDLLESKIGHTLHAYAREHSHEAGQIFFAEETAKGLRLLELMSQRYDVVVTNPPYLDSRDMNDELKKLITNNYGLAKRNLFAPFIIRSYELCKHDGYIGMITGQAFMFIQTFEQFRKWISSHAIIESLLQFDYGLFDGVRVDTAAFVCRCENNPKFRENALGTYFRLVKEPDSESKQKRFELALKRLHKGENDPIVYRYRQADFDAIPGSPWVYWITPSLRKIFKTFPKLGDIAQPRQGLATADNFRFLRRWWEAGISHIGFGCRNLQEAEASRKRWFPYMKGGSFRRWYGNQEYVVNWERNGEEIKNNLNEKGNVRSNIWMLGTTSAKYFFRRGVTYSYLTSGTFCARISAGGFIFDMAGSSLFSDDVNLILAVLNSRFALYALRLINPTVNFQVGDLARLPMPQASSSKLNSIVEQAISLAKADSEESETTWDFIAPPPWPDGIQKVSERHSRMAEIEQQLNEEVYRLYGISDEDRRAIEEELAEGSLLSAEAEDEEAEPADTEDTEAPEAFWSEESLAKAWISYAVGIVMGQFKPGSENGLGRGYFDTQTAQRLRALQDADGLLVNDSSHPDDLATKVWAVLEEIFGESTAEALIRAALHDTSEPLGMLRAYFAGAFFKEHVQKYRKRPIYWFLRSSKGNYGIWLYYHRLNKDLLYKVLLNYVVPKIRLEEDQLRALRSQKEAAKGSTREIRQIEKAIDQEEQFVSELKDFEEKLRGVADLHVDFDINDGVIINMAPLWELIPLREATKYWEELTQGRYDWAHFAYQLWPERVREKCRTDRSLAIAHGLESICEVHELATKTSKPRGRPRK